MQSEQTMQPSKALVRLTFVIYLLHLFSAINGLLSPALIVTVFLTGWPSVIALIMSYIWKVDAHGTFLQSHFSWLISTFWWTLLWVVISWVLIATFVGMIIGVPMILIVGIWVIYRLSVGLFALNDQRSIERNT